MRSGGWRRDQKGRRRLGRRDGRCVRRGSWRVALCRQSNERVLVYRIVGRVEVVHALILLVEPIVGRVTCSAIHLALVRATRRGTAVRRLRLSGRLERRHTERQRGGGGGGGGGREVGLKWNGVITRRCVGCDGWRWTRRVRHRNGCRPSSHGRCCRIRWRSWRRLFVLVGALAVSCVRRDQRLGLLLITSHLAPQTGCVSVVQQQDASPHLHIAHRHFVASRAGGRQRCHPTFDFHARHHLPAVCQRQLQQATSGGSLGGSGGGWRERVERGQHEQYVLRRQAAVMGGGEVGWQRGPCDGAERGREDVRIGGFGECID